MFADLHLHTCFSDGTYTPEELACRARSKGLDVLALTDHDTVEGCERMKQACLENGMEFLTGVELTVEFNGIELHLLAYCVDIHNPRLVTELEHYQVVRQQRIREMVARLNEMSVPVEADEVFKLANCNAPGRPHIARTLVQQGYCRDLNEAFERFLKRNRPAWVPKSKMTAGEAIEVVHKAGGVIVLAHPGLTRNDGVIPGLIEAGLDGLECIHSKHSTAMTEHYLNMAENKKLLITGGSDCHGMNKGEPLVGTVKLPYPFVVKLRSRAQRASNGHFISN